MFIGIKMDKAAILPIIDAIFLMQVLYFSAMLPPSHPAFFTLPVTILSYDSVRIQ